MPDNTFTLDAEDMLHDIIDQMGERFVLDILASAHGEGFVRNSGPSSQRWLFSVEAPPPVEPVDYDEIEKAWEQYETTTWRLVTPWRSR